MELDEKMLLEAGRAIRPYLADLDLTGDDAAALDSGLAAVLSEIAAGSAGAVFTLLTKYDASAEWLLDFQDSGLPPALKNSGPYRGGLDALGGDGELVPARRFRCPEKNDYVWYRRSAAHPVRVCPNHQVRLVPDLPA